jgi:phospholipase C
MNRRFWALILVAGVAIAACGGGTSSGGAASLLPDAPHRKSGSSHIQHVVVIIQENRSFDNFFATFSGADGATSGQAAPMPTPIAGSCAAKGQPVITQPTTVPLTKVTLLGKGFKNNFAWDSDLDHIYPGYLTEKDGGKMDGFDLVHFGADGSGAQAECTYAYQYVDPNDIQPYWDIAKQYVLADHAFTTQGSSSFTGHQALIAGGTAINYDVSKYGDNSVIDNPYAFPWGCDSPPGTHTALITTTGSYLPNAGPRPCYTYQTLRDLLDAKKLSWKYYAVAVNKGGPGIWSAFDAIDAVRHGSEWQTNVTKSPKVIFSDISKGKLPNVAWVAPDAANSDHPYEQINGVYTDNGPSWVASVVNAIGQSKYWKSSAIVILWDDSGGFYDHEPPAFIDNQGGLGFRIPMLIVSPYVQAHVEHTQYETASIVKFIEDNWSLGGPLQTPDARANSIGNAFNFNQSPRPFQVIPSQHSRSFFLNQKPSGLPVDTE